MLRTSLQSLFELMDETEYRSASYFSERLDISLKTVRNYMKELTSVLKNHGADVESKARHGYRIVIHDQEQFARFIQAEQKELPKTSTERNQYLLNYLLTNDGYVKIDELCSLLYISRTSISGSIHMVEKTLNQYGIHLERKPNYGIRAVGDEFDIRRLLCYLQLKSHSVMDAESLFNYAGEDFKWLASCILELLEKYDVHLTEVAFDNFVNYVYIGIQRILSRKHVDFCTDSFPPSGIKERALVRELGNRLQERYGIEFTPEEEKYILLYLSGKQVNAYTVKSNDNFVISREINQLSQDILRFIDKEYHSEFQNDFELRMTLNQHLVPLEVRMKYGLPLTNPLLHETKKEYPLAYGMALHAKTVLCNHYKKDLSDYEIGYLALIFALQLKKSSVSHQRKQNILIVSNANTSALKLLKYQYENNLSPLIGKVYLSDIIGLKAFDFSKIDYVFTTSPIMIEIPAPIFEIDLFMGANDTRNIENALWEAQNKGLRSCYSPKRFIPGFPALNKEQVLKDLCDLVGAQENVNKDFFSLVMEREKDLPVLYGNGIAIPHPDQIASEYTFAYLAVLEQPIEWNGETVQVILLSSPGSHDPQKRQTFYESAAKLVLNKQMVDSIIQKPTFEHFVELMNL